MRRSSSTIMHIETCFYRLPEWVTITKISTKEEYKAFKLIYFTVFGFSFRHRFNLFLNKRQIVAHSFIWRYKGEYIGIYTLQEEEPMRVTLNTNFRVIYNLAITPDKQGKGLGRVLIKSAITETANLGCQELILKVAVSNSKAINLYEQIGFKVTNKEEVHE